MSFLLDGKLTDNQLARAHSAMTLMSIAKHTETSNDMWQIARAWQRLESIGGILRRRYEYYCSVETDEKFQERLERVEKIASDLAALIQTSAPALNIKLEHNRDPRGAALKLTATHGNQSRTQYFG